MTLAFTIALTVLFFLMCVLSDVTDRLFTSPHLGTAGVLFRLAGGFLPRSPKPHSG